MFDTQVKESIEEVANQWNQGVTKSFKLTFIQKKNQFIVKKGRKFVGQFEKRDGRWEVYVGDTREGIYYDRDNMRQVAYTYIDNICNCFGFKTGVAVIFKEM